MKRLWSVDKDTKTFFNQVSFDTLWHGDSPEFIAYNTEQAALGLVKEMLGRGYRDMVISVSEPEHSIGYKDTIVAQGIPDELERVKEYIYQLEMENRVLRDRESANRLMVPDPVCHRKHVEEE